MKVKDAVICTVEGMDPNRLKGLVLHSLVAGESVDNTVRAFEGDAFEKLKAADAPPVTEKMEASEEHVAALEALNVALDDATSFPTGSSLETLVDAYEATMEYGGPSLVTCRAVTAALSAVKVKLKKLSEANRAATAISDSLLGKLEQRVTDATSAKILSLAEYRAGSKE